MSATACSRMLDACIFVHVSNDFSTAYGPSSNGMVSVEYTFHGRTAHAAGDPWDGRSALDAVELMDVGMNFRREHLPLSQRTHYVISDGGGQPNIVPGLAEVWYYFREHTFDPTVKSLYDIGNKTADAAAMQRLIPPSSTSCSTNGRAQFRQQADGRTGPGQYRGGWHATMDGGRPGLRQACSGNPESQGGTFAYQGLPIASRG